MLGQAVNLLHFGFAFGAVTAPWIHDALVSLDSRAAPGSGDNWRLSFLVFAAFCAALIPVAACAEFRDVVRIHKDATTASNPSPTAIATHRIEVAAVSPATPDSAPRKAAKGVFLGVLLRDGRFWLLIVALCTYNGSELLMGGWLFSLSVRVCFVRRAVWLHAQ